MPRLAKPAQLSSQSAGGLLGGLSVDEFLQRHWQRRPLLVRRALPDIEAPLSAQALMQLASDDSVQSRLVSAFSGRWRLAHGPFESDELPSLARKRWTLLVQGVNLYDDRAHELMSRFRFIPDVRLDDLMISLASDQGGVGPHLDSYDVFLVQVWGTRRWQIAPPGNDALRQGLPLKILEHFEPTQSWLLEPGDMLYLPPGWAHDGVAEGPCMTASVGFRAPSRLEFLREFLAHSADEPGGPNPRFSDTRRAGTPSPAQLPHDLHQQLFQWAANWKPSRAAVDHFIGRFLTEPAAHVFFDADDSPTRANLERALKQHGVRLDRRTRMTYRGREIFINGESTARPTGAGARLLRRLADLRVLEASHYADLARDEQSASLIIDWVRAGWAHPAKPVR